MNDKQTERTTRDQLFGLKVSKPEHVLLHGAARAVGADSASAWARQVLIEEARKAFRGALRSAMEPQPGAAEPEKVSA